MHPEGHGHHYEEPVDPDLDPAHPSIVLAVSLGGGAGAAARLAADRVAPEVWATLAVNLVGCALIGVLVVLTTEVWQAHPLVRPLLGTGVLGGFTTFSAYTLDTHGLWVAGDHTVAAVYLVGTLLGCVAATAAAAALTRSVVGETRA